MAAAFGKHDAAPPRSSLLCRRRGGIEGFQPVRRNEGGDVLRNKRLAGSVIVVAIPEIERHLEIVDHHKRVWAMAVDDFYFLREREIGLPVGVEISEQGLAL